MIHTIDQTHPLFQTQQYNKDKVTFNLMELIKQAPLILESNGKDFIIGRSAPKVPVWIWTDEGIAEESIEALCNYMCEHFAAEEELAYVGRQPIVARITKAFEEHRQAKKVGGFVLQSYVQLTPVESKKQKVQVMLPTDEDVEAIAQCMAAFQIECFGGTTQVAAFREAARTKLSNPLFFVIKERNSVVATAQAAREVGKYIAISGVYTKPQYRGRGFAQILVDTLCQRIHAQGKLPMLYADVANPASNRAYKQLGFEERGIVEEVRIRWKNNEA